MIRPWALPLVPLYWLGLRLKNAIPRRTRRLANPVLSVGSLSAGGAGKTPVVMALADLLTRHGLHVDILSRGYGRDSGAIEAVDPAGPANRFGDEPLEMAQAGLKVFVGADRHQAGLLAETNANLAVHLLDDGFQHRRLWRDADILLLTLADARDWLLPAGNLREPLSSLKRADAVVLREEEAGQLSSLIRARTPAPIWLVRRTLHLPPASPRRLLAFCGIARPQSFFAMLQARGCELAGAVAFLDHHAYRREDLERLAAAAADSGAQGLVTTAKDAVKLTPADRLLLEHVGPLLIARLQVEFVDEQQVRQQLCDLPGMAPLPSNHSPS